ncbi:MAG TPA: hypothetical protein ACFYDZ_00200 [Candidatus Brocadiaceae bacterium]
MNKGLWIVRKNYLETLVKKVSESHGGDDKWFLDAHIKEVLDSYSDEKIEEPIACYEQMVARFCYNKRK